MEGRFAVAAGLDRLTAAYAARNGMPETRPYVYRGTGTDTLTGDKSTGRIEAEIRANEGGPYRKPLLATDVWRMGEISPQDPDSKRAERAPGTPGRKPRPRCGKPLTGHGRTADYCGRAEGHPGRCAGRAAYDRDRWRRTEADA